MVGQPVLLVAGVDALGAVAREEIHVELEPRDTLEDRHADFLGAARVDRGLVDHHVALFEHLPTDSLDFTSGVRSGRLYSSIGVGTVTMNTRQAFRSLSCVV
jgi:hypothetical protein